MSAFGRWERQSAAAAPGAPSARSYVDLHPEIAEREMAKHGAQEMQASAVDGAQVQCAKCKGGLNVFVSGKKKLTHSRLVCRSCHEARA